MREMEKVLCFLFCLRVTLLELSFELVLRPEVTREQPKAQGITTLFALVAMSELTCKFKILYIYLHKCMNCRQHILCLSSKVGSNLIALIDSGQIISS